MNSPKDNQSTVSYAALFVDFDNVYSNLAQQDNEAAHEFAASPDKWLTWLEKQLPPTHSSPSLFQRRILIRRCYLNPQAYANFRPFFIRSAFEVIDCPPLTSRGKTSTDIHMVMDILDALNHETYFSEFIVLSGDADFTPVLLRIRKHGRYSVAPSVGYVSPAYKAACDLVISQDTFIGEALGIDDQDEDTGEPYEERDISEAVESLLQQMAARLHEAAAVPGGIEASELPAVYKEFAEFKESDHWLGFYSLRSLTQALIARRDDLTIIEEDPWKVATVFAVQEPEITPVDDDARRVGPVTANQNGVRAELAAWIKSTLEKSVAAVPMATLAQAASQRFREQLADTSWLGAETFKTLLTQLSLGNLRISARTPGFVYDPSRHQLPGTAQNLDQKQSTSSEASGVPDNFALQHPDFAPLARKIHQLTDTPYLLPEYYALLLQELAREIDESGYQMSRTSKTVRDRCVEKGARVARSHVNFVLIGIAYTGYRFGRERPESPRRMGEALVQNIISLCRTAQLDLTDEELPRIREWILGRLAD